MKNSSAKTVKPVLIPMVIFRSSRLLLFVIGTVVVFFAIVISVAFQGIGTILDSELSLKVV